MKSVLSLAAVLVFIAFSLAEAQEFRLIGAEELKRMIDDNKATVVDARTDEEYIAVHIPGAMSISPERVAFVGGLLPKDKKRPVVFYCRGHG